MDLLDPTQITHPLAIESNEIIRATLYAREQEFRMIQMQLQQQLDIQSQIIDRLERTVSASTDRLMRRLDRITESHRDNNNSKRSCFNNRRYKP